MLTEKWVSQGRKGTGIDLEPILGFEVDRLKSLDGSKSDIGLYLKLDDRYVRVRLGAMFAPLVAIAIKKTIDALAAEAIVDEPWTKASSSIGRPVAKAEGSDAAEPA